MKTLIAAGALALSLALGTGAAEAKTNVDFNIYFGVPHYSYQFGPDYVYRRNYGWYRPGYSGNYRVRDKLSCGEARRIVRNNGYKSINTRDCNGRTYAFSGWKNGRKQTVYVNSRNGNLWRG